MVIGIFGESCTGKSTLAEAIKAKAGSAELYTGKDYLRLAGSESEAERRFSVLLSDAAGTDSLLIYVASEPEQLRFLPDGALRVRMTAALPLIKERFAARTGGKLPPPVAAMLEKKHGRFDALPCDLALESDAENPETAADAVLALAAKRG